jgi:hypothetical protein
VLLKTTSATWNWSSVTKDVNQFRQEALVAVLSPMLSPVLSMKWELSHISKASKVPLIPLLQALHFFQEKKSTYLDQMTKHLILEFKKLVVVLSASNLRKLMILTT